MKRNPKTSRRTIKAMTNPRPEFVSMVGNPANMTPYRAVKADDGGDTGPVAVVSAEPTTPEQQEARMADTHDIARIVFKAEKFSDEAAVRTWLEAGGYTDCTVATRAEGGFEVLNPEVQGEARAVETPDGVTVFVVQKAAQAEAPQEGTEPAAQAAAAGAPAQETAQRAEAAPAAPVTLETAYRAKLAALPDQMARKADDKAPTLRELLAWRCQGWGLPVGSYELVDALTDTIRYANEAGDMEAVRKAGRDFGEIIAHLIEFYSQEAVARSADAQVQTNATAPGATVAQEDATMATKQEGAAETAALETPAAATEAVQPETAPAATEQPAATAPAEEPATPAAAPAPAEGEVVAQKSADPLASLTALVTTMVQSVNTMAEGMKAVRQDVTALTDRVSGVEGSHQTRKGADAAEVTTVSTTQSNEHADSVAIRQMRTRSVLGMRG